jgi:phosphoglycerol transferase MdoB-like AlkP superfamily enzyme
MGRWVHTNEWGVDDEALFAFVERTVADDVPSLNLLLSTSNHPPYDVDVWKDGWPVREVPPELAPGFAEAGLTLREIGHHAYADAQMGAFLRRTAARLPGSVFAVTGDHYSRKFPGARPTLYERTAVPLLLYGPEVLAGVSIPRGTPGSHLDIVPTLVDLTAPAGFEYSAIGRSLLDPARPALGIGPLGRVIGPGWIADFREELPWEPVPGATMDAAPSRETIEDARRLRGDVLGVSWWRVLRGAQLPAVP